MTKPSSDNRVKLDGEWDLNRRDELLALIGTLTTDGPATVDLRGCTYADSTVLSCLFALKTKFEEVPITLLGPSPQLRRILQIVAFEQLFQIVDEE
jgi:anti-anti-sigma factor